MISPLLHRQPLNMTIIIHRTIRTKSPCQWYSRCCGLLKLLLVLGCSVTAVLDWEPFEPRDGPLQMPDAAEPTRPRPWLPHLRRARSRTARGLHDPLRTSNAAESTFLGPWLPRRRRARPGTVRVPDDPLTHTEAESTRRSPLLRYQRHAQPGTARPTGDTR